MATISLGTRTFDSGKGMSVDKGIETRIFPFYDDVEAGSHRSEHSGGKPMYKLKFPSGNPKDQRFARNCNVTQVSGEPQPAYNKRVITLNQKPKPD